MQGMAGSGEAAGGRRFNFLSTNSLQSCCGEFRFGAYCTRWGVQAGG